MTGWRLLRVAATGIPAIWRSTQESESAHGCRQYQKPKVMAVPFTKGIRSTSSSLSSNTTPQRLVTKGLQSSSLKSSGGFKNTNLENSGGFKNTDVKTGGGFKNPNLESSGGFKNPNLENSGGFKNPNLESSGGFKNPNLQSSGGFKNTNLQSSSGFKNTNLKTGGGLQSGGFQDSDSEDDSPSSSSGNKKKKAGVDRTVLCGEAISGEFHLEIVHDFDNQGRQKPAEVKSFRAVMNGKEWTPQNALDYVALWPSAFLRYPEGEQSSTRHVIAKNRTDATGWPGKGYMAMNVPSTGGRELSRKKEIRTVTNGVSDLLRIMPPVAGRSEYIENTCFIP